MKRKPTNSIYVMWNFPFVWLIKVGISGNPGVRKKYITDSMPGVAVTILSLKTFRAKQLETFVHGLCGLFRAKWFGSGKTEWFYFPALFIALPVILIVAFLEFSLIACIALLIFKLLTNE